LEVVVAYYSEHSRREPGGWTDQQTCLNPSSISMKLRVPNSSMSTWQIQQGLPAAQPNMVSTIITKNLYRSVIHFSSIQKASFKKSYSDFSLRYSLWNPVRHLLHVPEPQLHIPIFWTRQGKNTISQNLHSSFAC
jgi:hypothetical protein